MKKILFVFCCLCIFSNMLCAQLRQNPPKIIATIPESADCNVDPDLDRILLTFNQDMGPGMSIVNTSDMPDMNGKVKWINKRTISIPVKLYPDRIYSLAFNNANFQNFRNSEGIPMNPDELLFQTTSISKKDLNITAYSDLLEIFPSHYSYASLRGIDWDSLLIQNREEFELADTDTEFALKLVKLLRVGGDPHLWVEVNGQKFNTGLIRIID